MQSYWVREIDIRNLWGHINHKLEFTKDVNIIIGPNASGKTTILNLLRYVLIGKLYHLHKFDFAHIKIKLNSFNKNSQKAIKIFPTDTGYNIKIGQKSYDYEIEPRMFRRRIHPLYDPTLDEISKELNSLVPIVWLPVSRKEIYTDLKRESIRSKDYVNEKLNELLSKLKIYRLEIDTRLYYLYKQFEKEVLQIILYNEDHDQIEGIKLKPLSNTEKDQLIDAFKAANLLDSNILEKIDKHFSVAHSALKRIKKLVEKTDQQQIEINDIFIVPLISRTKSMIKAAQKLDKEKDEIFKPIYLYENLVNDFLEGKEIKVDDNGVLSIKLKGKSMEFNSNQLSSGEKQILILLTQALLWEANPVVYMVDEPELSLHISWQEKLINSLLKLGGEIQIIAATHSPDIVSKFGDNVINLGRKSK